MSFYRTVPTFRKLSRYLLLKNTEIDSETLKFYSVSIPMKTREDFIEKRNLFLIKFSSIEVLCRSSSVEGKGEVFPVPN
jgi:hypothetical protein